jgi:hypothetical protein
MQVSRLLALRSPDPNRRTAFASRTMAAGCASLDAAAIHCCSDAAKNQQPKGSGQHYPLPVKGASYGLKLVTA